jgi:hypothetical protein
MNSQPIFVECYSGSRSDERPRSVTIAGNIHAVTRLLSESIEETTNPGCGRERRRRYRVLTEDGLVLDLIRTDDGRWSLSTL